MPKIPKTKQNPRGLSIKQQAVIQDIVQDVKQGKKLRMVKSTAKFYNTKDKDSSAVVASNNLSKINYRLALLEGLKEAGILGKSGKVKNRLTEGLNAVNLNSNAEPTTDYNTRLNYIKEINKIAGVYAPEKHQTEILKLSLNLTEQQLNNKILQLTKQLG